MTCPRTLASTSKVRVTLNPQESAATKAPTAAETTEASSEDGWGEIEITFAPIKRE